MTNISCPIWGTKATLVSGSVHSNARIDSPRAGGRYAIAEDAFEDLPGAGLRPSVAHAMRITTWIVDQRRSGVRWPVVNGELVEQTRVARPLRYSQQRERALRYFDDARLRFGSEMRLADIMANGERDFASELMAWLEIEDFRDLLFFFQHMVDEGYFNPDAFKAGNYLVPQGQLFQAIEQLQATGVASSQGFVAMWFDGSMDRAYAEAFQPALAKAGYSALRIDKKEHGNKIDDEIVAEIRASRFVVADFTCPIIDIGGGKPVPSPRGGVYYEAGLAQGLGIPVIWTVRKDCLDHVHFDTRQYAHLVWTTAEELHDMLYNRVSALIGRR